MRTLVLCAFAALLLGACTGVIDNCPDGLRDPPWGSGAPNPHKGP